MFAAVDGTLATCHDLLVISKEPESSSSLGRASTEEDRSKDLEEDAISLRVEGLLLELSGVIIGSRLEILSPPFRIEFSLKILI